MQGCWSWGQGITINRLPCNTIYFHTISLTFFSSALPSFFKVPILLWNFLNFRVQCSNIWPQNSEEFWKGILTHSLSDCPRSRRRDGIGSKTQATWPARLSRDLKFWHCGLRIESAKFAFLFLLRSCFDSLVSLSSKHVLYCCFMQNTEYLYLPVNSQLLHKPYSLRNCTKLTDVSYKYLKMSMWPNIKLLFHNARYITATQ